MQSHTHRCVTTNGPPASSASSASCRSPSAPVALCIVARSRRCCCHSRTHRSFLLSSTGGVEGVVEGVSGGRGGVAATRWVRYAGLASSVTHAPRSSKASVTSLRKLPRNPVRDTQQPAKGPSPSPPAPFPAPPLRPVPKVAAAADPWDLLPAPDEPPPVPCTPSVLTGLAAGSGYISTWWENGICTSSRPVPALAAVVGPSVPSGG